MPERNMADQTLNTQRLINADKDFQTVEDFIKKPKDETVTTRFGDEIMTLKGLEEEVKKSGGYFKRYTSLAAANADLANIPVDAVVKVTSAVDGGDYEKVSADATTLTKSAYDPLTLAKKYADSGLHDLAVTQLARKNLVDVNAVRIGKTLSSTDGSISTTQVNPDSTGISQFIAIKPNTNYTFSGVGPVRVSFFADAIDSSPCLLTSNAANPKTILSPSNAKYLVVNLKTPYEPQATTLQVEEGEEATALVPYNKIDANLVYGLSAVIDQQFSNKFLINEGEAWEIY